MTATLSTKGQIVIPRAIREALELKPGDDFEIIRRQDEVVLRRIGTRPRRRLSEPLQALRGIEIPHWDEASLPRAKKVLLDSNMVSELTKAKPDAAVVAWLDAHEADCAVSRSTRSGRTRHLEGSPILERDRLSVLAQP